MNRRGFFRIVSGVTALGAFGALFHAATKKPDVDPTLVCGFERRGDKTLIVMTSLKPDGTPVIEGYGTFSDRPNVRSDGTVAYDLMVPGKTTDSRGEEIRILNHAGRIVYDEKAHQCKMPGQNGEIAIAFNDPESRRRLLLLAEIEKLGPYPDPKKLAALLSPDKTAGVKPDLKP